MEQITITEILDFNSSREIALIGLRLLDDAYMAWVAAESEAGQALRSWSEASGHGAAYQAYRAAVDREEAAARDLQRLHELTQICMEALLEAQEPGAEAVHDECDPTDAGVGA
jgi:hypothetical protein